VLAQEAAELALGDDEQPGPRRRHDGRLETAAGEERGLAVEVARPKPRDDSVRRPRDRLAAREHEELTPELTLAGQHRAGWDVDLVGAPRDHRQRPPREAREERQAAQRLHLPEGHFACVELLADPVVLVVPAGSEQARDAPPSLDDLATLPLIGFERCFWMDQFEHHLRAHGIEPRVVFRSHDNGIVQSLVAAGRDTARQRDEPVESLPHFRAVARAGSRRIDPGSPTGGTSCPEST
jgi:hypothetical protein